MRIIFKNWDGLIYATKIVVFRSALNKDDLIFVGGLSKVANLYNFATKKLQIIDIEKELLIKIYGEEKAKFVVNNMSINCSSFSKKDSNIVAFGGSDSILCVKNIQENRYLYCHENENNISLNNFHHTNSISFSENGKYLATANEDGKTILWDNENFKILHVFEVNKNYEKKAFLEQGYDPSNHIHHVEFSPNSQILAIGTSESKIIFWDIIYKTKIDEIDLNIEPISVYSFAFNEAGDELLVAINKRMYLFQNYKDFKSNNSTNFNCEGF